MILHALEDMYAAGEADGRADNAAAPPSGTTAAQVAALAAAHIRAGGREAS